MDHYQEIRRTTGPVDLSLIHHLPIRLAVHDDVDLRLSPRNLDCQVFWFNDAGQRTCSHGDVVVYHDMVPALRDLGYAQGAEALENVYMAQRASEQTTTTESVQILFDRLENFYVAVSNEHRAFTFTRKSKNDNLNAQPA